MISKNFRLDLEALFSQIVDGQGFLHYGYWPDGTADEISLRRLSRAQHAYFDQLAGAIPEGTTSILDVGSGTGSNALRLLQRNYSVDCVCPSARLNEIARRKLPQGTRIFESTFEDLETDNVYDLLLFSESFHYLDVVKALPRIAARARKHVLIFDYFSRTDSATGRRLSHRQFIRLLNDSIPGAFRFVTDRDVTEHIIPTFKVLDTIKNDHVRPFLMRSVAEFRKEHRVSSFLLSYPLRWLLGRFAKTSNRYANFAEEFEYRLVVLTRT
ncbi:MAG: class I SAM-dependent methyltransferase [Burkholderiales bacterium]